MQPWRRPPRPPPEPAINFDVDSQVETKTSVPLCPLCDVDSYVSVPLCDVDSSVTVVDGFMTPL